MPAATYHFVHEVLDADLVQDTIRINEQDEEVVVPLEILGVDFVDQFECRLLTMALATVREP